MLIDNWLYQAKIIHAYERRVPIEADLYCDFYLPEGKVYIEFWGMEEEPRYKSRKEQKIRLYAENELNLVQVHNDHIKDLDDHLPRMLLKYGIHVK